MCIMTIVANDATEGYVQSCIESFLHKKAYIVPNL